MKIKNYIYGVAVGVMALGFASCENDERIWPDYDGGTTAYFANQYPVRTLVLGNDIYDNSLDRDHKCAIFATMGGAYEGRNAIAEIAIDNSLCDNLYFVDESENLAGRVIPMPAEYYSLSSNQIKYNGGMRGSVEVQFKDAFFNDPKAIETTYVIPLVMKSIVGVDSILSGKPRMEGMKPARTDAANWEVLPMDYVLYCVKYVNPWHASYIRRGADHVVEVATGKDSTFVRKDMTYVNSDKEHNMDNPVNNYDEVCNITTLNMNQALFPVSFATLKSDVIKKCGLVLTFDGDKCNITSNDDNVKVTGKGEYITKGTELEAYKDYQWGSVNSKPVHRDILRLEYTADFGDVTVTTNDTLVVQDRGFNKKVTFTTKYVQGE